MFRAGDGDSRISYVRDDLSHEVWCAVDKYVLDKNRVYCKSNSRGLKGTEYPRVDFIIVRNNLRRVHKKEYVYLAPVVVFTCTIKNADEIKRLIPLLKAFNALNDYRAQEILENQEIMKRYNGTDDQARREEDFHAQYYYDRMARYLTQRSKYA